MGVKRGPDGVPIDVPSVMHDKAKAANPRPGRSSSLFGDDDATIPPPGRVSAGTEDRTLPPAGNRSGGLFPEDPPTVPAGGSGSSSSKAAVRQEVRSDDPPTVIAGAYKRSVDAPAPTGTAAAAVKLLDPMADPVVGWLVVVDGPGKGAFLKLGNGQNSIGRGQDQRVCIDFGDEQISRQNHATLTFDPRGRNFYLQQGSGTNLAYLNDEPVLAARPLTAMNRISLGDTTLLFVPLCGESFSWN